MWEAARKVADKLERKPVYYGIIQIVDYHRLISGNEK